MDYVIMYQGLCPYCGKNAVHVIESEINDMLINKNGYPEMMWNHEYKVGGYCESCDCLVYIEPDSRGGYTVFPFENGILVHNIDLKILKAKGLLDQYTRIGMAPDSKENDMCTDDHPFTTEVEDDDCPF